MSAYKHSIKDFEKGRPFVEQIKADKLNAILRELESLRITQVLGGSFKKLPGGTQIIVNPSKAASTPTTAQPWDLVAVKDPENEGEYKVTVVPGTLNGILPSNWDINENVTSTELHYAKAIMATDGQSITGVTIEIDTTAPTVQVPQTFAVQTSVEYLFGLFFDGQTYRAIPSGHIELLPAQWLVKNKATPAAAGALPYDIFYLLQ